MNTKDYFDKVNEYIDKLTDEEFMQLLKDAGIEKCPYEDGLFKKFIKWFDKRIGK